MNKSLQQLIRESIQEVMSEVDWHDEYSYMRSHGDTSQDDDVAPEDTERFIITAKSGPQTVYYVDSLTQGKRFIPNAESMAVEIVGKNKAETIANQLKDTYHGLRNSITIEKSPAWRHKETEVQEISTTGGASMPATKSAFSKRKFNEDEEGVNIIDGQSNSVAASRVNKILSNLSRGLFSDNSWQAINNIFSKLRELGLEVNLLGATYGGKDQTENGMPKYKEWKISIPFVNNKGRQVELMGQITAHGAGTMEDPLSRYDITAMVTPVVKRMEEIFTTDLGKRKTFEYNVQQNSTGVFDLIKSALRKSQFDTNRAIDILSKSNDPVAKTSIETLKNMSAGDIRSLFTTVRESQPEPYDDESDQFAPGPRDRLDDPQVQQDKWTPISHGFFGVSTAFAKKLGGGSLPPVGHERLVVAPQGFQSKGGHVWLAQTEVGNKTVWSIRDAGSWRLENGRAVMGEQNEAGWHQDVSSGRKPIPQKVNRIAVKKALETIALMKNHEWRPLLDRATKNYEIFPDDGNDPTKLNLAMALQYMDEHPTGGLAENTGPYYERLEQALTAAEEFIVQNRIQVDPEEHTQDPTDPELAQTDPYRIREPFLYGGISYGQTKNADYKLVAYKGKPTKKYLHVNIRRTEQGRYEMNLYVL